MELTREQAITEHRKMWRWIAEQYENGKDIDPYRLKEIYLLKNGYDAPFLIQSYCFLCEYTEELWDRECNNCPLIWSTTGNCMETSDGHRGLYGQLMDCYFNLGDMEECAELARQIAELPEKQLNTHYNKEETRSKRKD